MKTDQKKPSKDSSLAPSPPEGQDLASRNRLTDRTSTTEGTDHESKPSRQSLVTRRHGENVASAQTDSCQTHRFDARQWERMFNTVTNGMRVIDLDFKTRYVNDAFCQMAGVSRDEALNQSCYKTYPGSSCHTKRCPLTRIAKGEELAVYDVEKGGADGQHRNCIVSASPLLDEAGSLIAIVEDLQDVEERRRAQTMLRVSEAQLEESNQIMTAVLDRTHMMAVLLDAEFNFVWVNPAYADSCQHPPSFFPGKNHFKLYPHEENQMIFQRAVDTGEPFLATAKPFEFPDQPERGVTYWNWSLVPVKDGGGVVTSLVFTLADVTEQIRAEVALRESEELHRIILDNISDAVFITDDNGTLTFVCPNAHNIFGHKKAVIFGMQKIERLLGENLFNREQLDELGELANLERSVTDKFAVTHDLLISVKRVSIKGGTTLYSCRDITQRKKAEEQLKRHRDQLEELVSERTSELRLSEEKFQKAFVSSPDGVTITRLKDGLMVEVNDGLVRMLGYSREELLGKTTQELGLYASPDDRERLKDSLRSKGGSTRDLGLTLRHKSGELRHCSVSVESITLEDEPHLLSTTRDITDRRAAERALKAANDELEIERSLLQNKNIALNELMDQIDQQKLQASQQLQANVNRVVRPMLSIINDRLGNEDQRLMELLNSALDDLMDPSARRLEQAHSNLSPRETEVCNMIRQGFSSKQMASVLNVSVHTINTQRRSIRKKLNINDNQTNLETFLKSI